MTHLGIGVLINQVFRNCKSVDEELSQLINIKIKNIEIKPDDDDELHIAFENGKTLIVADKGRSCCESRYMHTDDDLNSFAGATYIDYELSDANYVGEEFESHEIQFLKINTSLGTFTVETHNEHNGYYGGFFIEAKIV